MMRILKKYNKYILKNLDKFLNMSSEKKEDINSYKNKYELKEGIIYNKVSDKYIPLIFNPTKDVFTSINQINIKSKINFFNIYEYLITITKYKENKNFYDDLLKCRREIFF